MRPFDSSVETECIYSRYPREITAPDGTELTLTPLVPSDWQMLESFLRATPHEERRFFRHDASDPLLVQRWCSELDYRQVLPLLAWSGDRIVADGILQREPSLWTSHVGRLRLLVHPDYRGRGVGTQMIRELIDVAEELDLHKLIYECAGEQANLIAFLRRAGFAEAARLPEFIRDRQGRLHDMVLMVLSLGV